MSHESTRIAAFIASVVVAGIAGAAEPNGVAAFSISAQPLSTALIEFSKQANIQVLTSGHTVEGARASGASGKLTPVEALERMLEGSGFTYRFVDEHTLILVREKDVRASDAARPRGLLRRIALLAPGAARQGAGDDASASSAAEAAASEPEVAEVLVTARKKTETLIDVPMNITAVGSAEIADRNLLEPQDLYRTIAGGAAPEGQLILRGLSGGNSSFPNTTSTFTDGVPGNFGNSLFDVERVEVLRGPQGTLWGSNAIGGTVQVITNPPRLNVLDVFGSLQTASEHNRPGLSDRLYAGVNLPLIDDRLALRLTGFSGSSSKKTVNTYNGFTGSDRDQLLRAKLLWQANDDLAVTLGFIREKSTSTGRTSSDQSIQTGYAAAYWYGVPGVSPDDLGYMTLDFVPDPDGLYGYGDAVWGWVPCEPGQIRAQCRATTNLGDKVDPRFAYWELVEPESRARTDVATLNVSYEIADRVALSYVGALQRFRGNSRGSYSQLDFLDIFASPYLAHYSNRQESHELRFASVGSGPWSWTLGAYANKWSRDRTMGADTQWIPDTDYARRAAAELWGEDLSAVYGVGLYDDPTLIWLFSTLGGNFNKERALFGETSYNFDLGSAGKLELTGGLRYYELSYGEDREENGHFGSIESHYRSPLETGVRKKVSVSWRPRNDLSTYALYSEGYRPGGANIPLTPSCERDPLAEEFRLNYLSDKIDNYEVGVKGALLGGRSLFTAAVYNIDWTDVRVVLTIPAGCGFTANAGLARSRGVEFESSTRFDGGLTLTLNASYTNSEYRAPVETLGVEAGEDMTQVPKYNFYTALRKEYSLLGRPATARIGVAGYGKYKSHFKATPEDISDGYVTTDISSTLQVSEGVRLGLYVDNLFDEDYATYRLSADPGAWPDMAFRTVTYGRERTFTLRADFNF